MSKKPNMKKYHFSKTFLNKDGYLGIASMLTSVQFSTEDRLWHSIELKISDCRNEINLDLRLDDEDRNNTYENSVHKVDTMIKELTLLKVAMVEAKVEYDKRDAEMKAKKAAGEDDSEPSSLIQDLLDEDNPSNSSANT